MTMTFFLHESLEPGSPLDMIEHGSAKESARRTTGEFPRLLDKFRVPRTGDLVERERIRVILDRSVSQFPATLISGRAGTGKTTAAASFAADRPNVAWYNVETTDVEWSVFSQYFSRCLTEAGFGDGLADTVGDDHSLQMAIAKFLVSHFLRPDRQPRGKSALIVLDDIHHIFDAEWFGEFFKLLLYSLPSSTHLLLLCRSKPPSPLWRLRSKQVLNVIDEDQLAFTNEETVELFKLLRREDIDVASARDESYGRVSKLIGVAGEPADGPN